MKKLSVILGFLLCSNVYGGTGSGKVLDVSVRASDDIFIVRIEHHTAATGRPACATWGLSLAKKFGTESAKALYSLFLSAKATGEVVFVQGSGACLTGTAAEEITEANVGPLYE